MTMKNILSLLTTPFKAKPHHKARSESLHFFDLNSRPQHGSGLSIFELQKLKQKNSWYYVPDVRLDGNTYVVRIRGEIFKTQSTQNMLAYLKSRASSFQTS
jgi:hypothetical protein